MKVRSVSTAVVEASYDWTIVRIEADNGHVGWGEAFYAPGLSRILAELGELVVGADPRQVQPLVRRLYAATSAAGSTGGIVCNAISGLDAALWDLNARMLGVPLWQLFGGRVHERVRLYARCRAASGSASLDPVLRVRRPAWAAGARAMGRAGACLFDADAQVDPVHYEQLADQAHEAVALGFDGLKFDLDLPGLLPRHPGSRMLPPGAQDLASRIMTVIRRAVGPYVDVAYDCNWRYDLQSATRLAEVAAEHDVWWLEDPLPPENTDGLRSLASRCMVPLAGGENVTRHDAAARLLETGALSVLTPDLGKAGGYSEARRIAEAADAHGVTLAPHNIAGPIGTAFAAQVACTWPNLAALEYTAIDVPFYADLVGRPLLDQGAIEIGDRPGIGVEPDLEVVAKYAKEGEGVFC